MSDAEWDADDFEPNFEIKPVVRGKWDDEDEEDDVKDNWDDDDDEVEEKDTKPKIEVVVAPVKNKKKILKENIAKKEQQKQKEKEQKEQKKLSAKQNVLTPKQVAEERLLREKEQQQCDLEMALEALGFDKAAAKTGGEIDTFEPTSKEDFVKFANLLTKKIENYKSTTWYTAFLENLFRDLIAGVDIEGMRKITSSLSIVYNEKLKLSKSKPKKKTTKATLNQGRDNDMLQDDGAAAYDYDDFM